MTDNPLTDDALPDDAPPALAPDVDNPLPSEAPGGNFLAAFMGGMFPQLRGLFDQQEAKDAPRETKTVKVEVSPLPLPVRIELPGPALGPGKQDLGLHTGPIAPPPLPLVNVDQLLATPPPLPAPSAGVNTPTPALNPFGASSSPATGGAGTFSFSVAMPQAAPVAADMARPKFAPEAVSAGDIARMPSTAISDVLPSYIPSSEPEPEMASGATFGDKGELGDTLSKLTTVIEELSDAVKEMKRRDSGPSAPGQQPGGGFTPAGPPTAASAPGTPGAAQQQSRTMPPARSGLASPWLAAITRAAR